MKISKEIDAKTLYFPMAKNYSTTLTVSAVLNNEQT
jgi:hypothetical protein